MKDTLPLLALTMLVTSTILTTPAAQNSSVGDGMAWAMSKHVLGTTYNTTGTRLHTMIPNNPFWLPSIHKLWIQLNQTG